MPPAAGRRGCPRTWPRTTRSDRSRGQLGGDGGKEACQVRGLEYGPLVGDEQAGGLEGVEEDGSGGRAGDEHGLGEHLRLPRLGRNDGDRGETAVRRPAGAGAAELAGALSPPPVPPPPQPAP